MADEPTPTDEPTPDEQPVTPAEQAAAAGAPVEPAAEAAAEQAPAEAAEETPVEAGAEAEVDGEPEADVDEPAEQPRVKPAIPGADLEVDIVGEGEDPLGRGEREAYGEEGEPVAGSEEEAAEETIYEPIAAVIELAADARYRATGKRKTAVARVILKPGTGEYLINGKALDSYFPASALQRTIRQPLETVGYEGRMDVIARMHGGGVSAQAGALRHGISRALLEADPNLRGELKRRGFLTRDARVKERKKAGLKKARKRPQFSKR